MSAPQLALGISAPGTAEIIKLAQAVQSLQGGLRELAAQANSTGLGGLNKLNKEVRTMRQEMVAALNGLRTDLTEGFNRIATQVNVGTNKVEAEGKRGAVKVRAAMKAIAMGGDISVSATGSGLGVVDGLRKMQAHIAQSGDAIKAGLDKIARDQVKFEDKQKARWAAHLTAQKARLEAEQHMMEGAAAKFRAIQAQRERDEIRSQVRRATAFPVGSFSSIHGASYGKMIDDTDAKLKKATGTMANFNKTLNDGHSAARGLASGFGAMWLTWGNLLPLLAGATLSHAFVQTIKMGSEVQHTMQQIRVLSQESAQDVAALEQKLFSLAKNGPIGPMQLAKAMKTLSLAGLSAKEVYAATVDVLNFAVAGDTSIEQAADVMTTVGTVFNITAENYSHIGDTIAKAAAMSKSSVENMGEAFKTASVIHQQYGVSLEDTALGLSLVANAGIRGTAAGTALRNMYADLSGRTPKVTKVMEELGVKGIDPVTGKMRKQAEVFNDLIKALAQRTPEAQFKAVQAIFSERGEKEATAILNAMRRQAKEMSKDVLTIYDELAKGIGDASGFAAIAAANLAMTPLNQMKSTVATLQTVMVEAFNSIQPQIMSVANQLKDAFNSPGFRNGLADIINGVATATTFLVEHARVIASVGVAYMGLRGVIGVINGITGAMAIWAATTAAGITTVAGAARMATLANPLLMALVGIVTAAAGAWSLYAMWANKGGEATEKIGNSTEAQQLLARLKQEEERLMRVNQARREGITLMELEAKAMGAKLRGSVPADVKAAIDAVAKFDRENPAGSRVVSNSGGAAFVGPSLGGSGAARQQAADVARQQERARLVGEVNKAEQAHLNTLKQVEQTEKNIIKLSREATEAARVQSTVQSPVSGTLGVIDTGRGSGRTGKTGGGGAGGLKGLPHDNRLAAIESVMNSRLSELRAAYSDEIKLLEDKHRAGKVSEGTYQAQVLSMTLASEAKQREVLQASNVSWLQHWEKRKALAQKTLKGDNLSQALQNLQGEYDKFTANANEAMSKVGSETFKRQAASVIALEGETRKLVQTNEQYWAKAEQNMVKDSNQSKVRYDLANATDEVRAAAEAAQKVEDTHASTIQKLYEEYAQAFIELTAFNSGLSESARDSDEAKAKYTALTGRIAALGEALELSAQQMEKLQNLAKQDAVNDVQNKAASKAREDAKAAAEATKKEFEQGANKIAGDLADAILQGGQDGGKSLREWLKNYFIREPIRVLLQATLAPIGNLLMSFMGSAGGGAGGSAGSGVMGALSGGGGGIGSAGSMFSTLGSVGTVGSQVLGGTMSLANAFGTVSANAAGTGISGLLATNGAYGTAAAGAGGLGASLGSIVPVIGWAVAIYSLIKAFAKKGETRYGGHYGSIGGAPATFLHGPSGGSPLGSQAIAGINASQVTINNLLAGTGSAARVAEFYGAYESSSKGRGGVYSGGTLTSGISFGERSYEAWSNRSPSTQEAMEMFQLDLKQSVIAAVRASTGDMQLNSMYKLLKDVNAEALSDSEATELIAKMGAIVDGVRKLGELGQTSVVHNIRNLSMWVRDALIEVAGGFDVLAAGIESYATHFFSESEKRAQAVKNIQGALRNVGLDYSLNEIATGTRDQFRAIVDSLDLTTENGRRAFAAMMSLSGTFAQLTEVVEVVEEQVDSLAEAKDQLREAYEREKSALEETRDKMEEFTKRFKDFRDGLLLGSLSPLTPGQKYSEAAAQYAINVAQKNSGDLDALAKFDSVASAFLEASRDYNASGPQYQSDFQKVLAETQKTVSITEQQKSTAVQQLEALDAQVGHLIDIKNSTMSVTAAIQALHQFLGAQAAAAGAPVGPGMTVKPINPALIPAPPVVTPPVPVAPPAVTQPAPKTGVNPATGFEYGSKYDIFYTAFPPGGYGADGGLLGPGRMLVGEDGPEIVDFRSPGRVYTAAQTQGLISAAGDSSALLARIDKLCAEIAQLRAERAQATRAQISAMTSTADRNADRIAMHYAQVAERERRMQQQRDKAVME